MSDEASSHQRMVFVVGNSRSGTTMMARALGRHSQIAGLSELHFLEQQVSAAELSRAPELDAEAATQHLAVLFSKARLGYFKPRQPDLFRSEARALVDGLQGPITYQSLFALGLQALAAQTGKTIACEQTPRNVFYIGDLLEWYPGAVVVHMIRDPRDVLLSQKNKWRRRTLGADIPRFEAVRSWMNYHPLTISHLWTMAVQAGLTHKADPRVVTCRFEDVLTDPETVFRDICTRLDLGFEADMLNVEQIGSSARADISKRQGTDPSRIASWAKGGLSDAEIQICEKITKPLMERLGYAPSGRSALLMSLLSYGTFPFKILGAFAFNLRRVKGLLSWLQRRMGVLAKG